MVTIVGQVFEPSGLPTTTPFKVWLVSYGTDPQSHTLYVSPSPLVVTPDPTTGEFTFEVWANTASDAPCYYRVQFDFGLQLKLLVPASTTPLEFTDLIVDDTVELIPGILNRVAKLEDTGGVVIPTQNFSVGGWLTSPPVAYDGTAPVVIPVDSINSQGLTGVIPKPLLSGSYNISLDNALSFGQGLTATSGSYSGGSANTVSVDATIARRSDTAMSDPREWLAATVTQVEAESGTGIGRRAWTPERVFQAITAWVSQYLPSASLAEAELGTGTSNLSWSPSKITALVSAYTSSNGVNSVAGKIGEVTLVPDDIVGLGDVTNASNLLTGSVNSALVPLAQSATRLATARTLNGVPFDGTTNVVVPTPSSLTFGTGLLAGSFNGSSATTIAVDTGVVVQQSDSRLTDAREWNASTVTQAEAEAGTSTSRRAWTPQRVTQAIAGWWASSTHKVKLDSIATGAQVNTVTSVATKTGAVTLVPGDVGLGNVPNVNATVATNIASGTLADSRLSSNVALLNTSQTYTGSNVYATNSTLRFGTTEGLTLTGSLNNGIITNTLGSLFFREHVNNGIFVFQAFDSGGVNRTVAQMTTSQFRVWVDAVESLTLGSSELNTNKRLVTTDATDATSTVSAASIKTLGGGAFAKDIYCNKIIPSFTDIVAFTPAVRTNGDATEATLGSTVARYSKMGNKCEFFIDLTIATPMSTGTGQVIITGLPFPCMQISGVSARYVNIPVGYVNGFTISGDIAAGILQNTSNIYLWLRDNGSSAALAHTSIGSGSRIMLSGFYFTA